MKKVFAVFLSFVMALSCFGIVSFAAEEAVTVSMVNFNVAGLPNVGSWIGKNDTNVSANQATIASYLNENDFDVIAVQEDFSYHSDLIEDMNYSFTTNHSGSFLGGDGLNIFTKSSAIYNEKRTVWNKMSGVIEGGADELSRKGILYTVLDMGNGIYVDFYNIHADAYGRPEDVIARADNFAQLAKLINENCAKNNRPVIVTGDFNSYLHSSTHMRQSFLDDCGLKDAWVEVCNGGDYNNFSYWENKFASHPDGNWGNWDSVERFFYKDGGGVTVEPSDFKYTWVLNDEDVKASDHVAAECDFTFTKTADFVENSGELKVVTRTENIRTSEIFGFVKILITLLLNLDEVFALL